MKRLIPLLFAATLTACAVNPVTGDRDFITMSPSDDLKIGTQNYQPMLQAQGGAYDVDPALTEYVQGVGQKLAAVSDVQLPYEFTVLNSSVPNAWALPGGKIAINRGLLTEMNSEAELAAVLGHEIVHAAARHSAQQMSRGQLLQGLVVATSVVASDAGYADLAIGGAGIAAQLISTKYGRSAELESDKYGMRYMAHAGYDPQGAVSLQETFVRLSEGRNQDWIEGLFASHPPSHERVKENRKRANKMEPGGFLGVTEYQAALQQARSAKPAYDIYDEGRKALAEDKVDEALALANDALDLYPAEANFHALRGDVRLTKEQFDLAITNYDRAIGRRESFFYYYVQRGLARKGLHKTNDAIQDLERSIELLPTAPAHYHLGLIRKDQGRIEEAVEHFTVVAKSSGGEYGKAANGQLARLQIADQPEKYVSKQCAAGSNGNVVVAVRNEAAVAITGVRVQLDYSDSYGNTRRELIDIGKRIEAGQVAQKDTGIRVVEGTRCDVQVIAARVAD
ncbi:MAG: M48 family metalloprotease [Woeseiaceae bacterium]